MLRMLPLSLLLFVGLAASQNTTTSSTATNTTGKQVFGGPCLQSDNHLAAGTYQLTGDCEASLYCAANETCANKGCRRDLYPYGYGSNDDNLPPLCPEGQFCPDEEDACQPQLSVGSACQLDRDDECQPPPNAAQLANSRNVNGSICLNFECMWANVTSGETCIVENIAYVGYGASGNNEYLDIISRGNCATGLWCDSQELVCKQQQALGGNCTADKECESENCLSTGYCGNPPGTPETIGTWVYIVVAVGILGFMAGILTALFIVHRRKREEENEKRRQYWDEQHSFRQNILQMREQARASLLSLPWQDGSRGGSYYAPSDSGSQTAILHAVSKASGLRNGFGDSEEFDDMENLVDNKDPEEEVAVQRRRKMSKSGRNGGRI